MSPTCMYYNKESARDCCATQGSNNQWTLHPVTGLCTVIRKFFDHSRAWVKQELLLIQYLLFVQEYNNFSFTSYDFSIL